MPELEAQRPSKQLLDIEFTEMDVRVILQNLQPDKSPGLDNIHPKLLKECAFELAGPLTAIFRRTLEEGKIPSDWKEAAVTPVYKKGSRKDPSNYRPISLTSTCCKVMERLIRKSVSGSPHK